MKVFLSSTFRDLAQHRKAATEAIERLGLQGSRMEVFGARPEEPMDACLNEIDESDIFVGIYAHRYGYVPPGSEISITEAEYRHAQKLEKPICCFLIDDDHPWQPGMIEAEPGRAKLSKLKEEIRQNLTMDTFTTPEDLALKVATAVSRLLSTPARKERAGIADQAAAVCYRGSDESLQFLLIKTSGRRWLFPKGWIESGEPEWRTAEREALEEAGVLGEVRREPLTTFRHHKRELKRKGKVLGIAAYLLRVDSAREPREPHREPTWFSPQEAEAALAEDREYEFATELIRVVREARAAIEA